MPNLMGRAAFLFYGVLLGLLIAYFGNRVGGTSYDDDEVVARVGDRVITVDEFRQAAIRRGGTNPDRIDKSLLLDELIFREASIAKVLDAGLDSEPESIWARDNILIGALRRRSLEPHLEQINITDQQIKEYYDAHQKEFFVPDQVRLAMLRLSIGQSTSAERRNELTQELQQVREAVQNGVQGRGFGALAIEHSDHQASRYRGGDIGWYRDGVSSRFPNSVIEAGFAIDTVGHLSEVLETENGLYLLMLMDKRTESVQPLDNVSGKIRYQLLRNEQQRIENQFKETVLDGLSIDRYPQVLERVDLSALKSRPDASPPSFE